MHGQGDIQARRKTVKGRHTVKRGSIQQIGHTGKRGSIQQIGPGSARPGVLEGSDDQEEEVPDFAVTLAGIFRETQEFQEEDRKTDADARLRKAVESESVQARGRVAGRRNTGPRAPNGRRLTDPMAMPHVPAAPVRRNVGELRDTDLRGYSSLQELLNSKDEFAVDEPKPENPPSRPSTVPERKPNRMPPLTRTDRWNLDGKREFPKFGVQQPPMRKPERKIGRKGTGNSAAFEVQTSNESDSSSESSSESSSSGSSQALLKELADMNVSQDWRMVLQFARDHHADAQDGPVCAGDDLTKWASSKEEKTGHSHRREVTIVTRPQIFTGEHERAETVRSPLRPGVYCGHGDSAMLLENGKKPPGLPSTCHSARDAHTDEGWLKSKQGWLSPKRKKVMEISDKSNRMARMLNLIMEEEEDERRHEDSRNYQAWRKKVIECARSMRLEVDRFQLEPKGGV